MKQKATLSFGGILFAVLAAIFAFHDNGSIRTFFEPNDGLVCFSQAER